jgi:multicomponent Na+:H+ antiporter subunit G
MAFAVDAASWIFLMTGTAFCVIGGIGMIRMPDFYTRSHAASLTDTLGAALILLGLGIQAGISLVAVKLLFIYMFLYITSPTSAHALVKAAYSKGLRAPHVEDQRFAHPVSGEEGRGVE